jgi:hypothetical protein
MSSATLEPIAFSSVPAQPALRVVQEQDGVSILLQWELGASTVPFEDARLLNEGLIMESHTLHAISNLASLKIASLLLPTGKQTIAEEHWPAYLEETVMQWRNVMPVQFDPELIEQSTTLKPSMRLYLSERDKVLVMHPAFQYGNTEIRW